MRELIEREEVKECFESLWKEAFEADSFETMCALLRFSGIEDANWDTLQETEEALEDFSWHIDAKDEKLSSKSPWRIGLLTYCQLYEISAVHAIIANLLRILKGERCHINPLAFLNRPIKNQAFKYIPPSAKVKWRTLLEQATEIGKNDLVKLIDSISHDSVRNAFSHSDYIITDEYFRWTEGHIPSQIHLKEVEALILNTFRFMSEFMRTRHLWLVLTAQMPRYYKWKNYEVFELLKSNEEQPKLIGFQLHYSNGSTSKYKRTLEGVDCKNIIIKNDGTLQFMCGLIDALKKEWMVDGKPVNFNGEMTANSFDH